MTGNFLHPWACSILLTAFYLCPHPHWDTSSPSNSSGPHYLNSHYVNVCCKYPETFPSQMHYLNCKLVNVNLCAWVTGCRCRAAYKVTASSGTFRAQHSTSLIFTALQQRFSPLWVPEFASSRCQTLTTWVQIQNYLQYLLKSVEPYIFICSIEAKQFVSDVIVPLTFGIGLVAQMVKNPPTMRETQV